MYIQKILKDINIGEGKIERGGFLKTV